MQQTQPMTSVALYARVSSDRQDVDLSVAAQLRALRDFAERNGYVVAREYIDEAESGRTSDRPQFTKMLDEAAQQDAPFQEILVWKFSRFTRKREHAVAFKSMLRRRGIRVTSITEHADDTPTGKLMEAIIESVDEFYSENLAQEVTRGMREAASRGFWVASRPPYGYKRVKVQDGAKERPRLELNPPVDDIVRRIFDMAINGSSVLDITRVLNDEGIPTTNGKPWLKTTVHRLLTNEAYTGTLVWGQNAKDGGEPVRVVDAHPAIVTRDEYQYVQRLLKSRAPKHVNPRRVSSPYLLSSLLNCELCDVSMSGAEAKGGKYSYYVCQSKIKKGTETCETPRLNARDFERTIIDQLREHILTESNIRELVKMVDEEMDGLAREQRQKLESAEHELAEVKRALDRIWRLVETTDLEMSDAADRIREHKRRKEQLEVAAETARRTLADRRQLLDSEDMIAAFAEEMSDFLLTSELTETRAFLRTFIQRIEVSPGRAVIHYTIPMPEDSPIGRSDRAELGLEGGVRKSVRVGGPSGTRTQDLRIKSPLLWPTELRAHSQSMTLLRLWTLSRRSWQRRSVTCASRAWRDSRHRRARPLATGGPPMRELAILSFVTLDGVLQSPTSPEEDSSGGFRGGGWGGPYWEHVMPQVYAEAMSEPYDLLFGRRTYDIFAAHWPNVDPEADPVAARLNGGHKYVVTSSQTHPLPWGPSSRVTGDVVGEITRLKTGEGPLIQVHGSARLIQTLIRHDLIDEYRLWTFPVVVGSGKRLFGDGAVPASLELVRSSSTGNGVLMSSYRRDR